MTCEAMRGCGYRKQGGIYAVGNKAAVGGSVPNDCQFVTLKERIPVSKEAPNPGRGFIYVDGEAILSGQPAEEWGITPGWAEALHLMWEMWGLGGKRFDSGLCEGAPGILQVQERLWDLEWAEDSAEAWPRQAQVLIFEVDALRGQYGDCPLVPAIMESRRLRWLGPITNRPADTLATLWRLVTEISWVASVPEVVLSTVADIMQALGAGADVPLLFKNFPDSRDYDGD